ncbi:MAG: DUF1902 domain-containing protein [Clostridia bacterium]|nr:DUF1902 domain-containing protein [Clostridia bacterium]
MAYKIIMAWDADAGVWIATSKDVPGLVLESGSFDALIQKVRIAVPELLQMNGATPTEYRLDYTTNRSDVVAAYG